MKPDDPQPSSDDVPSPGGSFVVYDNPHNVRDFSRPKKASGGAGSSSSWQETIGALNAALSHVAHTQFTLPSSAPPPQPHQHSSQAPAKKVAAVTGGLWDGSSPECCVALLAVMQCPLHAHTSGHGRFVQCAQAVLAAHRSAQLLMIDAWKHMPHDVLVARFLRPLQGIVEAAITSASEANGRPLIAIPQDVMVCTQLLSIIYAASRSSASYCGRLALVGLPEEWRKVARDAWCLSSCGLTAATRCRCCPTEAKAWACSSLSKAR